MFSCGWSWCCCRSFVHTIKMRKLLESYSVFIDCYDVMMMAIIAAFNKNCLLSIIWLPIPILITLWRMACNVWCSMVQTNFRSLQFHPCDHGMWLLRDCYHNYWLRSDSWPIIVHYLSRNNDDTFAMLLFCYILVITVLYIYIRYFERR